MTEKTKWLFFFWNTVYIALIGDGKDDESECDGDNSDINADDADSDSNVAVHADSEAADTAVANNDSVDDDSSSVVKCTQQTDSVSHNDS